MTALLNQVARTNHAGRPQRAYSREAAPATLTEPCTRTAPVSPRLCNDCYAS
jgi:hypothetical protein